MSHETTFYLAGCVILDDQKRVLVVHRQTERRHQWELPGGRVEPGQDPRTWAAADIKAELGVDVEVRHQLAEQRKEEEGVPMHFVWFATEIVGGEPKVADTSRFDDVRYMSIDELRAVHHEASPNTRDFLEIVKRGDIRL